MTIPVNWAAAFGAAVIGLAAWMIKRYITKILDAKFDDLKRDADNRQKEYEEQIVLMMRGMLVMLDTQHELLYAVINEEHNGGLEECQKELDTFRADYKKWLLEQAAKWDARR